MLTLTIEGTSIKVTKTEPLVSGTIGMSVKFVLDSTWSSLTKKAVYVRKNKTDESKTVYANVDLTGTTEITSIIPESILNDVGNLYIGVCGTTDDTRTVTVYTNPIEILEGAVPKTDE